MSYAIYFKRVGWTSTGRMLVRLCDRRGTPCGRAFCIGKRVPAKLRATSP